MPKRAKPLTAAKVRTATAGTASAGKRYGDGGGLYLFVRANGTAFWTFRWVRDGKMTERGLGAARGPDGISLANARELAAAMRRELRAGNAPQTQKQQRVQAKTEAADERIRSITFREAAEALINGRESSWRNDKHRQQWRNTLAAYVYPHFGDVAVRTVGTDHVLAALEPIWTAKQETARRVRGRIESVLDSAKARGWRAGENPARWRGHLDHILPGSTARRVKHHAALAWQQVGAFMATLGKEGGVSALALRFAILTAARTGEVLGARWSEIDPEGAVWTVPAGRMKASREHRVPLSDAALNVLREAAELRANPGADRFVFPGGKAGKPLSSATLFMVLRRMDRGDLTVHGFRSTFRDWCAEATNYPRELAEAALAHTVGDETERAYQRGDLLEKRRLLMNDWAAFCLPRLQTKAAA